MSIKKILVAVDFSTTSEAAARYAVEVGSKLGADITFMHAFFLPIVTNVGPHGEVYTPPTDIAGLRAGALEGLTAFRAKVAPHAKIDLYVAEGTPASTILRTVADGRFDLIVMGTHGRTGLKHLVLGSVAEHVVRASPTPVLTVREPGAAQPSILRDAAIVMSKFSTV